MAGYQDVELLDYAHLNRELTALFNFHFPATGLRVTGCEATCTVQLQVKNREGKKWCQVSKHPGGQQNWNAVLPFLVIHSSPVYRVGAMVSICSKVSKGRPNSRSRMYPRNGTSASEVALRVIGVTALLLSANSQKAFPVHPASPLTQTFNCISEPFCLLTIGGYFCLEAGSTNTESNRISNRKL